METGTVLTPFERLAKKMEEEFGGSPDLGTDFQDMMKSLDKELPRMPPAPVVEPEYTVPFDKNFAVTLGKQPPPEPVEKNEKAKGAEKKDAGKKDEVPARVFQW